MISHPLVVVLALLVAIPSHSIADDPAGGPVCILDTPAPKTSARLRWRTPNDDEGVVGTWVSDPAMTRAAQRMLACQNGWETCQVDLAVAQGKTSTPGWRVWTIAIGVAFVIGIAGGFALGK